MEEVHTIEERLLTAFLLNLFGLTLAFAMQGNSKPSPAENVLVTALQTDGRVEPVGSGEYEFHSRL
jgi:hypothetical protein